MSCLQFTVYGLQLITVQAQKIPIEVIICKP